MPALVRIDRAAVMRSAWQRFGANIRWARTPEARRRELSRALTWAWFDAKREAALLEHIRREKAAAQEVDRLKALAAYGSAERIRAALAFEEQASSFTAENNRRLRELREALAAVAA